MIKKLIIGVILLSGLLLIPFQVQADDVQIIDGVEWELLDSEYMVYEMSYNETLDQLHIITIDAMFKSGNVLNFTGSTKFYEIMDLYGENIQSQSIGVEYTLNLGFSLSATISDFSEHWEYFVITTEWDTSYYKTHDTSGSISIEIDYVYTLDSDGGVNVYNESWTKDFTINGVLFEHPTEEYDDWANVEMYFTNYTPSEQNWFEYSNFNVWYGYDESTLKTNLPFTENYFAKYVNDVIAPYVNSELELQTRITAYINAMKTTGITIDLPPNFNIKLFVPSYYYDGIDYWYDILGSYDEVIITVPDLVQDGSTESDGLGGWRFNGEIWGDTLNYEVDGVDYSFSLLDNFNQTQSPLFTVRLSSTYFLVTFNTTGGSVVDSQWVEINGLPVRPTNPTRTNYTFCTWTTLSTLNPVVENDFICPTNPNQWNPPTITSNTTFYARWQTNRQTITLINNGGVSKIYSGWNGSTLLVPYNDVVANNLNNVPFHDMVVRTGYTLTGWYLDEGLTTLFNSNTPIQQDVTIFAKWTQGSLQLDDLGLIDSILESLGLNNMGGYILIYIIMIIVLFTVSLILGLPPMVLIIELIAVTALFMFMGMFTLWAIILIILAIALGVIIEIRR